MSALITTSTALRPAGLVLDVRPEPEASLIEIHLLDAFDAGDSGGKRVVSIGLLEEPAHIARVAVAEAAVHAVVRSQLFAREQERRFEVRYHFASVERWLCYMAEHWRDACVTPELITRARAILEPHAEAGAGHDVTQSPGELVIRRKLYAQRLRRL